MIRGIQKKQEIGIVKNQGILENQVKYSYISIGSNLGNKKKNIEKAKFELIQNNIWIEKSSNYYETLSLPPIAKWK